MMNVVTGAIVNVFFNFSVVPVKNRKTRNSFGAGFLTCTDAELSLIDTYIEKIRYLFVSL